MEPSTDPDTDLVARVAATCRQHGLLEPGDRVLVAVSGGADSSALAGILARLGSQALPVSIELAHIDHGWRSAQDAAEDLAVVRGIAAREDVPLHLSGRPQRPLPRTEDAARRWRYRQLAHIALSRDIAIVATGHHAMDQAETVLMRLVRRSGLVGLTGIPRARPFHGGRLRIVRPLLDLGPDALRAWLLARNLRWNEDITNEDTAHDRAAVRAWIRGRLDGGRDVEAGLHALRRRAQARLAAIEGELARDLHPRFVHHRLAHAVAMPRADLAALATPLLDAALRHAGSLLDAEAEGPWLARRHVALAETLLAREGDLDLPSDLQLHVRGRTAWLARRHPPSPRLPGLTVRTQPASAFDLAAHLRRADPETAAVDARILGPGPVLRLLGEGDRFVPHGSRSDRERPVRAWLARRGVPRLARRGQLVVDGAHGIAWVVGRRVDRRHLVGPDTEEVTVLSLTERLHGASTSSAGG